MAIKTFKFRFKNLETKEVISATIDAPNKDKAITAAYMDTRFKNCELFASSFKVNSVSSKTVCVSVKKFDRLCSKYNFERKEMIEFIKDRNIHDSINLCEQASCVHKVELTIGDAGYIMDHHEEFCNECSEPYTQKDMDGGRCISCGTMIV